MKLDVRTIKVYMANKRMTVAELARLMGIARQNLSTILTRGTCSIVNAGRIADALNVDVEEIVLEG